MGNSSSSNASTPGSEITPTKGGTKYLGGESNMEAASKKPSNMYLILPSYVEPQKQTIKKFMQKKKPNSAAIVCSNKCLLTLTLKLLLQTAKMLNN